MIEVMLRDRRSGDWLAGAEAADPEAALLAARTLWDDELDARPFQGVARALVLHFIVGGKVSRVMEARP